MSASGYRFIPHTADLMIESWGPTRAACFEQAVRGLVASFAEHPGSADSADRTPWPVRAEGNDTAMLITLLEEVVFLADARAVAPVDVRLDERGEGIEGTFFVAPLREADMVGAPPKAISYHALDVRAVDDGWRARFVVDV